MKRGAGKRRAIVISKTVKLKDWPETLGSGSVYAIRQPSKLDRAEKRLIAAARNWVSANRGVSWMAGGAYWKLTRAVDAYEKARKAK